MANSKHTFHEIRNYLAGQFVGATRDETILAEVIKCLFVRHFLADRYDDYPFEEGDHTEGASFFRKTLKEVVKEYPDLFETGDEFLLGTEELNWTIRKLWHLRLMDSGRDLIGDAFEALIGSALRGQEGQFFTPRNAIEFLVEAVDPSPHETIIDPACGTGGFLSYVFSRLSNKTKDVSALRIYGIDKDSFLARLAKIHLALLGGDFSRVYVTDSIAIHNGLELIDSELPSEGEFDVVLTNPPFGAKIVSAKPRVALRYQLAKKWRLDPRGRRWLETDELRGRIPPQLLFLEKCIKLLRPGGRCGIVLPESLISSAQYRYAVDFLITNARLTMVVGMPESLFKTSGKGGTHTKTCLVVFEKNAKAKTQQTKPIFLAEAKWCGNDSRGRSIAKDDLQTILTNFKTSKRKSKCDENSLGFWMRTKDIEDFSLCPRRYDPTIRQSLKTLEKTHRIIPFRKLVEDELLQISSGDEVGKLAYGSGSIPFVRTSDLSNWEIKADPKQCISEDVYQSLKDKQDVSENDILMVKDGTYLIGTCAIVTGYDLRVVYQSHLYKIRVVQNTGLLNPFLLLAVLSSRIVQEQIHSKRVTHDIIDSLGARIHELLLPFPKDSARNQQITEMVKEAIKKRVEARELAKKARELVMR